MGTEVKLSTAHHPQTDGQTERANRVLEEMLRHYISPRLNDWDELLPMAEFAVNNSWHESVQNTPFFLNYGQHPLTPVSALVDTHVPAAADYSAGVEDAIRRAKAALQSAQQRQKAYADQHRRELLLKPGDRVLLHTKHLRVPGDCRKLMPVYIGPFQVLKRHGPVSYQLDLPQPMLSKRIHPVFHVSLLKPYHAPGPGRENVPPPPIEHEEGPLHAVNCLLDHRETAKRASGRRPPVVHRSYLVDWEGQGPEHRTWQPEAWITPDLLHEYWAGKPNAPPQFAQTVDSDEDVAT
jgi:hypothetical protein